MRARDLFTDPDGTLSTAKCWKNIGYSAMTWAFVNHSVAHSLDWELLAAYGGIVAGSDVATRYLKMRSARDRRPD